MNQKQRRDQGLLYLTDQTLIEEMNHAKKLVQKLNAIDRSDIDGITDVRLTNAGIDYTMSPVTIYHIDTQMSDMTADLHKYRIDYIGTSIVFLSGMTLRHNYVISDEKLFEKVKNTANFDFVDKGERVCFELKDIPAAQLDVAKAFTLGDSVYRYSVLDYCKLVIADETRPQADKNLCMATYWYNDAAKAYFYCPDEYEDDMI